MKPIILDNIQLHINKKEVLKRLGFSSKRSILTSNMENLLDEEIDRFNTIAQSKAAYYDYDLKCTNNKRINVAGKDVWFTSASLAKHLDRCHRASIFACTIGKKIDEKIKICFSRDEQSRGIILDGIGSAAVEDLADSINSLISNKARQNRCLTIKRFSPGYKDWELQEQNIIFRLIKPSCIGITLTDSCIMEPEKSITGIIGWKVND